ncbi:MAG: aminotransferase class III-fold pyridoxal phosphate-dependent enzyme, partial [Ruminiclostridium sp.]|nr:aminotransferase class III-fold pyridoxal phosphate-dependent enzyme [Ruminiclostridium sp.]
MSSEKRSLKRSMDYFNRAKDIIPCQSQTLSKRPQLHALGEYPVYLKSGKGSHVFDVDGNEYVDYPMSLGPIILGHCYPAVDEAIKEQLKEGITFTLMHPLEVEVSELIIDTIPCAEMVRFGKSGSDACSAAVKVARAYTGRQKVASCGYHGWHDWYNIVHVLNEGTPLCLKDCIYEFVYNDIASLERIFNEHSNEIACVIMEPVSVEIPREGYLLSVKELCHKHGALLIFDEVVTCFRYAVGGAQEYFNVIPDLACIGKAMANGMPVSAFVGKKEYMRAAERLFISFTHGGEVLSLAAAKATINEIREKNVIEHITSYGNRLQKGVNDIVCRAGLAKYMSCIGLSPHLVM